MRKFKMKVRKGFALIFVIVIALAMIIPALILASSAIPRRTAVTGEQVSDRALAVADSTIDNILNQINTFPFTFVTPTITVNEGEDPDPAIKQVQDYLISYYLCQLNGGVPDINSPESSYNQISGFVSTYLYNLRTQEYFAVWDTTNNKIANVSSVGPEGDVKTKPLKNLTTLESPSLISIIDPEYKNNNIWVEIDTNTKYWPGEPDKWDIRVTAYLISKPEIKRTVQAKAARGSPAVQAGEVANGTWYIHDTSTVTVPGHPFCDYSGLYHTKVYFGRFETTTGPIRSDSNLYMGGWANDPVFANGTVNDDAVDAPGWPNNNTGRFGVDPNDPTKPAGNLAWAKANGYAIDGYPPAQWANVDNALYGSRAVRDFLVPTEVSLQDKAFPDYYVNGDATVVFSVENGTGYVTINGVKLPMPPNGAIFVEGTAIVSGTVKGQCSVGASKINIGGNIIYSTPPRLNRDEPIPENPDLLGLISHGDITISASTFNANHHLEIDAAMISKAGNFGIDANAPSHTIDPSGTYEAWWNGAQACWDTSNAPAVYLGNNKVRGYEVQHTNYDWNLHDYGVPPFYPTTSNTGESTTEVDHWPVVDKYEQVYVDVLSKLSKSQLEPYKLATPISIPGTILYYKYTYDGVDYYYGGTFGWGVSAQMQKTALYRITWKEQIAEPVKP